MDFPSSVLFPEKSFGFAEEFQDFVGSIVSYKEEVKRRNKGEENGQNQSLRKPIAEN